MPRARKDVFVMNPIAAALDQFDIGMPVIAANLTMFPLLLPGEDAPGYLTLDEALASGLAFVTEVSEAGSVPELLVKNLAPSPVLILDGEELIGAKQNRIVNLTILVAAGQTLRIPVSCVEAGRWAHRSREFAAAGRAHFATGRARKLQEVSCCMRMSGSRMADQGGVWDEIAEKASRMDAESPTGAAAEMYERSRAKLDEFVAHLEPLPHQAGALFAINGVVAGMDVFDSPATWRKSMRKLVHSYGLDALDRAGEDAGRKPAPAAEDLTGTTPAAPAIEAQAAQTSQPARFLAALKRTAAERFPAIGLGEDVRIAGRFVAGGGLIVDGTLIHLVAFPATKPGRRTTRATREPMEEVY